MLPEAVENLHWVVLEAIFGFPLDSPNPFHSLKDFVLGIRQDDANASEPGPIQRIQLFRSRVTLENLVKFFGRQFIAFRQERQATICVFAHIESQG